MPTEPENLTCIHQSAAGKTGLCGDCTEEYEADPTAYWEYGPHPGGIARWNRLQEEMHAEYDEGPEIGADYCPHREGPCGENDDSQIPF